MAQKFKPIVKLTPEAKQKLIDVATDMERAEHALKVMEELDMDVTEARDKLNWAKKAREMLITEFS